MSAPQTLEDVCSHIVDCEHKTAPIDESGQYFAVGTPAMRGNAINLAESRRINRDTFDLWTRRLRPQHGDLLFAREAPVGPIIRIPRDENVAPGQRTVLLRPDPGAADTGYLYYLLSSPLQQARIASTAAGSTVAHLNVADVRRFVLPPMPGLGEQRAIADVLGALDDKIAANRSVEATCDELVEVLYAQSVSDEAEERPLFDVFDVDFGEAFKGAFFTDPGVGRPLIRIRDLKTFTSQVWTSEERPRETVVKSGDVVVGMDAEFRATWWLGDDGLLNQRVCRVRGLDSTPAFVAEALRAPLAQIERSKSATTVIHLNKSDLQQAKVLMPNHARRTSFEAKAQPLVDHRVSLARQRAHLARMRDALLPLLMSGKVTVKDAESVVGEAV